MFCLQGRPDLERFRVLCTLCLVFDSLFVLIFSLSGISASAYSTKIACYEENGYSWHNIIALTLIMSAVFAFWGCLLHGGVVISGEGAPLSIRQLVSTFRFGHILVGWTFIAAVLEAIAYRQQPPVCYGSEEGVAVQPSMSAEMEQEGLTAYHVDAIWQMAYTVLWLIWVVGAVAAAMSAKRNVPVLEEILKAAEAAQANESASMPQLVGMPVQQQLPDGAVVVSGAAAQGTLPVTGAVSTGFPNFQGAAVPAGAIGPGGVAQGMPVRGEEANNRPAGSPKEV
eukprot:TRINITY_DN3922_c1_g1_i1.p1 TRINITY_DN3922_c1_g1~~TRINITY_DN3922_c1_g1_i1.p1  ORF type:complete len:283 (-),score=53.60 TRINITY_DN3922_c1_g1_i1:74-922(-)